MWLIYHKEMHKNGKVLNKKKYIVKNGRKKGYVLLQSKCIIEHLQYIEISKLRLTLS